MIRLFPSMANLFIFSPASGRVATPEKQEDYACCTTRFAGKNIDSYHFRRWYTGFLSKKPSELHFGRVFTLGQAIVVGTQDAFGVVFNYVKGFGKIFRGEVSASKALSGPIGIARMFGGVWDWGRFWSLTGLLSIVLAFMNALPIPALDGGHAVILSYEIISGRKPSDKFLENAQKVGMVLLLGLMAFAIFNDVWKAVF
jgi:RIP metalloprotease RseP